MTENKLFFLQAGKTEAITSILALVAMIICLGEESSWIPIAGTVLYVKPLSVLTPEPISNPHFTVFISFLLNSLTLLYAKPVFYQEPISNRCSKTLCEQTMAKAINAIKEKEFPWLLPLIITRKNASSCHKTL